MKITSRNSLYARKDILELLGSVPDLLFDPPDVLVLLQDHVAHRVVFRPPRKRFGLFFREVSDVHELRNRVRVREGRQRKDCTRGHDLLVVAVLFVLRVRDVRSSTRDVYGGDHLPEAALLIRDGEDREESQS